MSSLNFFVPAPESDSQAAWRLAIGTEASWHVQKKDWKFVSSGPLTLDLGFALSKPKSMGTKDIAMTKRPDLGKLLIACLEGLTEIVYHDPAQVIDIRTWKLYQGIDGNPGVYVKINVED